MRVAIYPGTFDPITIGHMDVVKRAVDLVDKLIIAIADDIPKTPIFDLEERVDMVRHEIRSLRYADKIEVQSFHGLLVDYATQQQATIIVRGLRAVSDFEYEFQLASMNARLRQDIQTVFLPASENMQFVASRMVKEVARLGGDISPFVSPYVAEKLRHFYKK